MAVYPYSSSGGSINQLVEHLRKRFPEKVDASMLKKLSIAPNNESYIINILKFINVLLEDGVPNPEVHDLFVQDGTAFSDGFADLIEKAYGTLFDLYGDDAWTQDKSSLLRFFRQEDKSTELVGKRQTDTFIRLAEIAGKREITSGGGSAEKKKGEQPKRQSGTPARIKTTKHETKVKPPVEIGQKDFAQGKDFSLAVRIEVNLPSNAEKSTYDAIFKSIRENLIDSE